MRLLSGRIPPTDGIDRFHYPVAGKVVLHADTKDELIRRIFEYRLRNHLPPGDPDSDVSDYYCAKWPKFCAPEPSDRDATQPRVRGESMLNSVSRWVSTMVHRMPRGGYSLVSSTEAESRAVICANCPKNITWKNGCSGCSATTLQLIQQLKALRKTTRDGNLSACAVTSAENSSSIWLPADVNPLTDDQRHQLPVQCWRK